MGKREAMSERELSFLLFRYLEWLSKVKYSTREKTKPGDLCVFGHRRINFPTKLRSTIKLKSMPKSPK